MDGHTVRERGDTQHVLMTGPFGITQTCESFLSGRNREILRNKSTGPSWGGDLVLDDEVLDALQIVRGEDESNVSLDVGKEAFGRIGCRAGRAAASLYMTAPLSQRETQI